MWCASLVCASATAGAVAASGLGEPTYLITGRFEDRPDRNGYDDLVTAELIERAPPACADAAADPDRSKGRPEP